MRKKKQVFFSIFLDGKRRFFTFSVPLHIRTALRIRFTAMKKFASIALALAAAFTLAGCAKENPLKPYVSELTENVYAGESENYALRGRSGFFETDGKPDGEAGETRRLLALTLRGEEREETVSATVVVDGEAHTENFVFNPVTFAYEARFEMPFSQQTFDVILRENGREETVTMTSLLPENTLSLDGVLDALAANRPELVNSYMQNGVFCGEIAAKVNVRGEKAYWYVGITGASGRTHAFLMDGASGEILAAKDIFR